ncbi:endonuclease/exonuclease/phosphatase family protein [Intrasporangium sp. YIM S08009]|uniref:endonuclease/exonuclease/phosphatase family protein n=1 Tax=Intrasporangium zincisolvens TaxID=3080018 RepID=UPI002B0584D1|nr:endonuclease/exonuclease/phosphatase family protein [Intrasporangium sp. YIM S08009]
MPELTVATVNTFSSALLTLPEGLGPVVAARPDVLALQEVHHLEAAAVARALAAAGLVPSASHLAAGLVLAHDPRRVRLVAPPLRATLQPAGPLLRWSDHWHERGALAGSYALHDDALHGDGRVVTVATAHLIVFARAIARGNQVRRLHRALADPRLATGPLVLAGDMNHYPGPTRPDRALARGLGLRHVELDAPTWRIRGSKHEWLARAGARLTGWDVERFDAELDAVLYRDLEPVRAEVVDVASDHGAVVCRFALPA